MMAAMIEGATRVVGKAQGFLGLPLRDEMVMEKTLGQVHSMVTAWTPNPDELAALNAGANVHIRLFGAIHPPIIVFTGPAPRDEVFRDKEDA